MKRIGNLYSQICILDNIILAEKKARLGKSKNLDIISFNKNKEQDLLKLETILKEEKFINSEYKKFTLFEKKERIIYKLPYYPDRIVHHAILNILEDIFVKSFTSDTYSCIKRRGIYLCISKLNKALKNKEETKYCLKLDIKKFYPSINHEILKKLLIKKFKDKQLLNLLNIIIDSSKGLPIGNYLSQYLSNFYLTYFDHWIKEDLKIKNYFRYCDDLVILSNSKEELHNIKTGIQQYLKENLELELSNYQVFPIENRGIDFLGYVSYHTHIKIRKSIKKNWLRMLKKYPNKKSKVSFKGWLIHCNSTKLRKKYEQYY